jgi:tRNA modification GTPase
MNIKMEDNDTIVAIATANGIGSISIVRLSGPEALQIALKLSKKESIAPRYATLAKLYDFKDEMIDEALLIYFKNPASFTGEDIVEFQCHGGIAISNLVLESTLKYGARLAKPGEFSKRAFLNGKIDLSKAQAIAKIIEARSEDGVKLLAKQLRGDLKEFVDDIRKDLLFMLAYTEVNIDYAEEDLPSDIYDQIQEKLTKIETLLSSTLTASKQRDGLINGFKVAIIGKPNVGKSSLLNKLLNVNRAIVSDIAGTTRDTIEESIKIGTHIINIVDTAGIREADDEIEQIGIKKTYDAINEADIILALFDSSRTLDGEDNKIIEMLNENEKETFILLTKSDLSQKIDTKTIENLKKTVIKQNTKENISELISKLELILNNNTHSDDMTLVSKQQITSVEQTLFHIQNAKPSIQNGELEFFAFEISEALQHISQITQAYEHKEMLDVMFGEFCLGK